MLIITIAVILLIIVRTFSRTFEKHGADKVIEKITISKNRIRAKETFEYELQIQNVKLLILPIINAIISIPYSFSYEVNKQSVGRKELANDITKTIKITTSLLSYQQVRQKFTVTAMERGFYEIKTMISAHDFLGVKSISLLRGHSDKVIVHPLAINYLFMNYDANSIQGEYLVRRWSNPDPIFYSGVREYTERDSLKDIDWKASAKQNTLLVKKYDTTSDESFMYFACTHRGNRYENDYHTFVEDMISSIAYMIEDNQKNGIAYAFNTNLSMRNNMNKFHLPALGQNHLMEQLDTLACATIIPDYTPVSYLSDKIDLIDKKCTLVFYFYELEEDDVRLLNHLMKMGYMVKVLIHRESDAHVLPQIETLLFKGGDYHA